MKNFKAGQKVIYVDQRTHRPSGLIYPKHGEIVKLKCRCTVYSDYWDIYGYEFGHGGEPQSFSEERLYPLEDYFKEQTESVVEKLESELQIEIPELV